jgi:RNA polymerase sigma factor (sigma-70 family)
MLLPKHRARMTETVVNSLLQLRRQFLGFIARRVEDPATAEDILQNAFLRLLDSGDQLRESDSAVAWFYRILRNAIIDHYRRRTSEGAALERWVHELESATEPEPALEETTCQCIGGALETLTPAYASLLREVDLGGTTLSGYAATQGITSGNAAVRAHRARNALRKQLMRCCGTCATHGCLDCTCRATAAAQTAS